MAVDSRVVLEPARASFGAFTLSAGNTLLGDLEVTRTATRPFVAGTLHSPGIDLARLRSTASPRAAEPLLDRALPVEWLDHADATVNLELGALEGLPVPIRTLAGRASLTAGALESASTRPRSRRRGRRRRENRAKRTSRAHRSGLACALHRPPAHSRGARRFEPERCSRLRRVRVARAAGVRRDPARSRRELHRGAACGTGRVGGACRPRAGGRDLVGARDRSCARQGVEARSRRAIHLGARRRTARRRVRSERHRRHVEAARRDAAPLAEHRLRGDEHAPQHPGQARAGSATPRSG